MIIVILLLLFLSSSSVWAAPPQYFQTTPVVTSGLEGPSGFEIAPDGRIFILERTGEVKIVKDGNLLSEPFAVLPSVASGDRGLIGIAFDPDFLANHYVYFYYTGTDLLNRLVRFNDSADIGTDGPLIIYQTSFPSEQLHVGGTIRFGPDGKMYFGVGDNGYPPNGQDLSNPHGKILRINKDGTIPADNPFVGQAGKLPEIWAYGFRNPWRFQFDGVTGNLYVGDVGEATWEEVNLVVKGGNYGWSMAEGVCLENCQGLMNPLYTYNHDGLSSAITAGPRYRASMFPAEYQGSLFFGDYARGFIKRLTLNEIADSVLGVHDFDTNAGSVVDMKVDTDGSIYYITYIPGALYRITYSTGNNYPVANAGADITKGIEPLTVNFSSAGSYDPDNDPLTYLWDFGDGTTSTAANPIKEYLQKGTYIVQLSVSDGTGTAVGIPIVIQVGIPPAVSIASPQEGQLFEAGERIFYSAHAIDAAGFDISEGNIQTEVVFHHGTHIHPFFGPVIGKNGYFDIPVSGEVATDIWYEVRVTATDTNGLATAETVNIYPKIVNLQLQSNPTGLKILLNGIPTDTGQTIPTLVGYHHELRPLDQQQLNDTYYQFESWSNGQSTVQILIIPETNISLTANYRAMPPFTGNYYNNQTLSGTPVLQRNDQLIDFIWNDASPDPVLPPDQFSVRWVKQQYFAAGRYMFTTRTDDGVRLYIDDQPVIDEWQDQGGIAYSHTVDLPAGNHGLQMDYYEAFGGAVAELSWQLTPDQPVDPTPSPTPTPTPTPTPPPNDELLNTSWTFTTPSGGASDQYQSIAVDALSGITEINITYNLNGHCIISGDASAIIFDQGGEWHYISLSDYGQNCLIGEQTVTIPLSDFPGLDTTLPVNLFHGRFWLPEAYSIIVTSVHVNNSTTEPTPTPTPTPPPDPTSIELLSAPWHLAAQSGTAEAYQPVPSSVLNGKEALRLTYNLNGLCALDGDASAIIFDQGGEWHYISLSDYGQNCLNGDQTVTIPLSDFPGLNPAQPVSLFHSRFWNNTIYNVEITSAEVLSNNQPPPVEINLLLEPWQLTAASGTAEAYQTVEPTILNGKTSLILNYNLNGLCALDGDASAIIFDQGGEWHYISLSDYGQNCLNGDQTVTIPLSDFPGLNPAQPVSLFHSRFWNSQTYSVVITKALLE